MKYLYHLLNLWLILIVCICKPLLSQTTLVAELGDPLVTTGWTIVTNGGGGYVNGNEFVLTNDMINETSAIYFSEPYNLNRCKEWRIEFEFKIWGNGTPIYKNGDGLAFWYLENPPSNFVSGGGIGIPSNGRGIMVVMDTFDNATEGQQSELQILYGEGYHEINNAANMYFFNTIPFGVHIRSSTYQQGEIHWDDGLITVKINGVVICSFRPNAHNGVENITDGYFGFSASTGAASDRHSIKNVRVYMDVVELNTDNTSISICDEDGDGLAIFDLTSAESTIIDNPQNYTIKYFASIQDILNDVVIPNPDNYVSGNTTIYVKVENNDDCFDIAEIYLSVNSMPTQNEIEVEFLCDGNLDGQEIVDLTVYQSRYINGDLSGLTFHYFTDSTLTNEIPTSQWGNYLLTSFPTSIWILAEKDFGNNTVCTTLAEEILFDLETNLPTNGQVFLLSPNAFCKDVNESISIDLTQVQSAFTNETAVEYRYYETQAQAIIGGNDFISDPTNYMVNASGSVYVRLQKTGFCFSLVRVDFEVALNPEAEDSVELQPLCDDDNDGFVIYDLDTEAIPLLVNDATGLTFAYYLSMQDAQNHNNPQPSTVSLAVGTSVIYWVLISNGTCELIAQVHLKASEGFEGLVQQVDPLGVCDDDFDGVYTVDLTGVEDLFLSDTSGVTFTYYTDSTLANPIPANQVRNFIVNGNTHFWVVMFNGECSAIREFDVEIIPEVPHNLPTGLSGLCEESEIDLTQIRLQITNIPDVIITYYETEIDAKLRINNISNPQMYLPDSISGTLYVRLEWINYCPVILPFEYSLSPMPENPFDELPTLCEGETVVLDAGDTYPDQNYLWTWEEGQYVGAEITITHPGTYTLTITTENNCQKDFMIEIQTPAPPVVSNIIIGSNYLIVEVTGSGGYIEYSLNGVIWQSDPRFDNLIPGTEYTVYVREDGCEPISVKAFIIKIPNFISPNGDGYNDTWTVRGLETFYECSIKIFDRYGKIFVDSKPQDSVVWNGFYLGRPVPNGDYWYILTTVDQNMNHKKYVGHISVRNRD